MRITTTGVWSERIGNLVPSNRSTHLHDDRMRRIKITYRWRRITDPDTQFVLVMRSMQPASAPPPRQLAEISLVLLKSDFFRVFCSLICFSFYVAAPPFDSWYHRLDLFKRDQACLYLRQLATFGGCS